MEEYQKMSSKEKRQLRNKISARNFRVRRKGRDSPLQFVKFSVSSFTSEYITTLEDEVAVRDQQLETYREELTSTKSENSELRKEIERLRQEIMEGRSGGSIFDVPPAETKAVILAQTNGRTTRASKNVAARPNRNKDLPSSGSTRGFWGGSAIGGTTPVHTTLIPDFDISALSGKPRNFQENLNPILNLAPASREDAAPNLPLFSSGLDGLHNFTLKGLDTDRMQLWTRMAREAGAAQAAREKHSASPASSFHSSLGSSGYSPQSALSQYNVNPLFLLSPAKAGLQAVQKEASNSLSPTPSQAVLATSISNTISGKLMGALWGAFAPKQTLDLDKVKRVLEGKAELRVVDVENSNLTALEESIKAMNLGRATTSRKSSVDALEEGLKGMSLVGAARMDAGLVANRKECGAMAAATAASTIGLFQRPMRAGHSPIPAHQPTSKHTVAAQH
jgi:cell division protein FtsB